MTKERINNYGRKVHLRTQVDYAGGGTLTERGDTAIFHEYTHIDQGDYGYVEAAILEFNSGHVTAVPISDFIFIDKDYNDEVVVVPPLSESPD